MDRANVEVISFGEQVAAPEAPCTQLSDLELAYVGGGIGDTVL